MSTFSTTRASSSQTHAPRTFDPRDSTCVRCAPPAGSAAHNSVLGCIFATTRSAAHNGVLNQLGMYMCMRYKVASSQLPAPQVVPRAKVALESRQSVLIFQLPRCSAYCSCTTQPPVLIVQLARLLRVLKSYYKVASSHLPAPQILRVLKLHYKVASSQLSQLPALQIAPRTKVVLESRQFSPSSSTDTPRTKVVLQSRQFSASSSTGCSAY